MGVYEDLDLNRYFSVIQSSTHHEIQILNLRNISKKNRISGGRGDLTNIWTHLKSSLTGCFLHSGIQEIQVKLVTNTPKVTFTFIICAEDITSKIYTCQICFDRTT